MKTSGLLIVCIFACLATAMDSSAEFHHLAFGPGVSVEGQFLASLAPQRDCVCSANRQTAVPPTASAPRPSEEDGVADEVVLGGAEDDTQRYWHVLVRFLCAFLFPSTLCCKSFTCEPTLLRACACVRKGSVCST